MRVAVGFMRVAVGMKFPDVRCTPGARCKFWEQPGRSSEAISTNTSRMLRRIRERSRSNRRATRVFSPKSTSEGFANCIYCTGFGDDEAESDLNNVWFRLCGCFAGSPRFASDKVKGWSDYVRVLFEATSVLD